MKSNYQLLLQQAHSLLESEQDPIANAANLASLIFHNVDRLNWAGFYFLRGDELVLGPFNGQVACTRIEVGKGVCGTAFATSTTQLVDDVHAFAGHIACDAASESEVVVPFRTELISGVLDIDSPERARFTSEEQALFEGLTQIYCDSLKA
jgi:GAF domain-containing protein